MPGDVVPTERIDKAIYLIRGQKVMLDRDLAALYGVETRVLNQAVKRHSNRFPDDFMFALSREDITRISQIVISSTDLARKPAELEKKYDAQFKVVFDAIRQLMAPPESPRKQIGFRVRERPAKYGARRKVT